jgi:hypothetical protein
MQSAGIGKIFLVLRGTKPPPSISEGWLVAFFLFIPVLALKRISKTLPYLVVYFSVVYFS